MHQDTLFSALALAAVTVGSLHSLAPDHWVPFAAVGRARGWSVARTAGITLLCGFGHVTVSVLLGVLGLFLGVEVLEAFGRRLESVAGILLIGFGMVYALWGLRRAVAPHLPGHPHPHGHGHHHAHDPSRVTALTLFLLFCADPCVAVVPLVFAAAALGVAKAVAIVLLYEVATLATMLLLVVPARAGARVLSAPWLDRYGDALAGATVAAVGVAVALLGW